MTTTIEAVVPRTRPERLRYRVLAALGVRPPFRETFAGLIGSALDDVRSTATGPVTALDAGCGRRSPLEAMRARIGRLVGVDIHEPDEPLPYLDEFLRLDMCVPSDAFAPGTFDLVLSRFAIEHLEAPDIAFDNMERWLRPGGILVASTVNRRHPFVRAYLGMPSWLRTRLQPMVKADRADAHRLVGACNDPTTLRQALLAAGFDDVRLTAIANLGHAWGRHLPMFLAGAAGDLVAQRVPSRRSSLIVVARKPAA
jgi:SAM-dependent methyltransferase